MNQFSFLLSFVIFTQTVFSQQLSTRAVKQLQTWKIGHILTDQTGSEAKKLVAIWESLYPSKKAIIFNLLTEQEWQIILEKQYHFALQNKQKELLFQLAFPLATVYHTQSEFVKGLPLLQYLYQHKSQLSKTKYPLVLIKLEEEYRELNDMSNAFKIRSERVEKGFISTYWELYANCNLWSEAIQDYLLFEKKPFVNDVSLMKYYWFLGDLYFKNRQFDSALINYQSGLKEATIFYNNNELNKKVSRENARYWSGNFSGLMGNCLFEMGDIQGAITLLQKDLNHSVGRYKIRSLISLTKCFLEQKNYFKAKENIDSLKFYLSGKTMNESQLQFYKATADYYSRLKKFDSAYVYLNYYNQAYENWGKKIVKNQSAFLLAKMEIQNRRTELANSTVALENAQIRSKSQKQQLYLLFGSLLATMIIAILIYRNNLQKAQSQKSIEAQNIELRKSSAQISIESARNETLLKELHHRVKNNLQLINSLINLQKRRVGNEEAEAVLSAIQSRILSMSFVHERLYLTGDLEKLEAAPYIESLVYHIKRMNERDGFKTIISIDIDDLSLTLKQAIAIGLIVNETVVNAFKYAFSNRNSGSISISLQTMEPQQMHLLITDDGPGILSTDTDGTQLGMKIIKSMCDQLNATYNSFNDDGLCYSIKFSI